MVGRKSRKAFQEIVLIQQSVFRKSSRGKGRKNTGGE